MKWSNITIAMTITLFGIMLLLFMLAMTHFGWIDPSTNDFYIFFQHILPSFCIGMGAGTLFHFGAAAVGKAANQLVAPIGVGR